MPFSDDRILFPYMLDHKPGFFLSWFLYRLFQRVHIDENMKSGLKQMQKNGQIVYAIKYRGRLDYLLYHYNFRRRRLPYPKMAFDLNISMLLPFSRFVKTIFSQFSAFLRTGHLPSPYASGYYKKAILQNTTSLFFLVDPKGFFDQFVHQEKDPIELLIECQNVSTRPIFIIPQLVLYQRSPEKDPSSFLSLFFGFQDHPGFIRKTVLFFRYHRHALIDFGQPLNLRSYLADQPHHRSWPELAAEIRKHLIENIDNQKRVVLGPIMKSRQQIKEMVLLDPKLKEKIDSMTSDGKGKFKALRKKVSEYFEEIAGDYQAIYIQFFHKILTWFWKKLFVGIDIEPSELALIREWARRGPLIYVPSHKSHIDYLILNYVLYNHNMHVPRIAAGVNLTFWPMGHIFRKCGAFFIRRTFKNAALYMEVFNRYIKIMLHEGFPLEFYIEGGRSRHGKLLLPKTGFLSILLQAYQEEFCRDLIFVPCSIIYDRVMEEKSYLKELGGAAKEKESLSKFIQARRFLKKKYGRVYIRFHRPFSLKEYLSAAPENQQDRHTLAFHIARSINAVSLITPLSLTALAILTVHRRGFLFSELMASITRLVHFIEKHRFPMAGNLREPRLAISDSLSTLLDWKILESLDDHSGMEENFYFVDDAHKIELEYYKNTIIHFFIPQAFVATLLLSGMEQEKTVQSIARDYLFMQNLFKNEFIFDLSEDLEQKVSSVVDYFRAAGFLMHGNGHAECQLTKLGVEKLPIWASLVKTFLESYWIVSKALIQRSEKVLKKEDLVNHTIYLGKRFHRLGAIDHIGALSRLYIENALTIIQEELALDLDGNFQEQAQSRERLSRFSQKLYEWTRYHA